MIVTLKWTIAVAGLLALAMSVAVADDVPAAEEVIEEVGIDRGQAIVNRQCVQCHGAGVMGAAAVGAPAWPTLLEHRTYEGLVQSVIRGRGIMPPRAGTELSDAELAAAVLYFLKESGVDIDDL